MTPLQYWMIWFGLAIFSGLVFALLGLVIYKLVDLGRTWVIEIPTSPGALANIKRKSLKAGARYDRPTATGASGEKDAVLADPDAGYPTMRGPLRIIHKETGYNLIAPRPNELPIALRDIGIDPDELQPSLIQHRLDEARARGADAGDLAKLESELAAAKKLAQPKTESRLKANAERALTWLRMQVCSPLLYWKAIRTNDHQDWLDTQTGKEHFLVRIFPFVMVMFFALLGVVSFLLLKILPALRKSQGG